MIGQDVAKTAGNSDGSGYGVEVPSIAGQLGKRSMSGAGIRGWGCGHKKHAMQTTTQLHRRPSQGVVEKGKIVGGLSKT